LATARRPDAKLILLLPRLLQNLPNDRYFPFSKAQERPCACGLWCADTGIRICAAPLQYRLPWCLRGRLPLLRKQQPRFNLETAVDYALQCRDRCARQGATTQRAGCPQGGATPHGAPSAVLQGV